MQNWNLLKLILGITFLTSLMLFGCKNPPEPITQESENIIIEVVYKIGGLSLLRDPNDSSDRAYYTGFFINEDGEIYSFYQNDQSQFPKKFGTLYSKNDIFERFGENIHLMGKASQDQLAVIQNAVLNLDDEQYLGPDYITTDSGHLIYRVYAGSEENEFLYNSINIYESCDYFFINTSASTYEIMSSLESIILEYKFDPIFRPFCGWDIEFDELIFKVMSDENLSMTIDPAEQ